MQTSPTIPSSPILTSNGKCVVLSPPAKSKQRSFGSHVGDLESSKKLEEGVVTDAVARKVDLPQLANLVFKAETRELLASFFSNVVVWNRQTAEIGTGDSADRFT